jgi:hypothetical protein
MQKFQVGPKVILFVFLLAGTSPVRAADPFAGVSEDTAAEEIPVSGDFFTDNFGFRKEVLSEFSANSVTSASRQSLGFEVLKKFSTETSTFAAVDIQARLVRRDGFADAPNDMEGMDRPGWFLEYHNAYADLYNVFGELGRFNFRIGHFYVPFGLNLQTDTHGTIFQLSNEQDFGFERDWYAGFYGQLAGDLNYDAYYLTGSGYRLAFEGQGGLAALRLSLSNRFSSETGLEGGLSFLRGGRLLSGMVVDTTRVGIDGRYRKDAAGGLWTWTSELSGGDDASATVLTQLHQLDYLHGSRRWGLSVQLRQFYQDPASDLSLSGEATWYFRNDVGNSNLQWIKLNADWRVQRPFGARDVVWTLQYYQYW